MAEPIREGRHLDREWLARHLAEERRESELLGEIREALFGMQDGLVSTLAVVSTVGGATADRYPILVAGIASALAGALVMGASFGLASLVPILPYLFLPVSSAIPASLVLCAVVVFAIGAIKTRWTQRNPIQSGLEVVVLAAFAGIAGYLFGSV